MNTKILFYFSILFTFIFTSCNNDDQQIGKWDDNIKLSQKIVNFDSNANNITITTQSKSWRIDAVAFNGTYLDLSNFNLNDQNLVIKNTQFSIERINGDKLKINLEKNDTDSERVLNIALHNGNYFDGIKVTQSKK